MSLKASNPSHVLESGSLLVYNEQEKEHEYIMCVDVAKGRGQDYSTFNLIDISVRPFKQVAVYRNNTHSQTCLLYTSPSPRDRQKARMPSSA